MGTNRNFHILNHSLPLPDPMSVRKRQATEKLNDAIGDAHDILVRASSAFPFNLFPDTVTVDRTKLTITHRDMFRVGEVMSIRIEDILNVTANVGPLYGSLSIATRFFDPSKPYVVNHFKRGDALKIKRIVQGYLIAKQNKVDCSALSTKELARTLDQLGHVAPEEKV